MDNQKVGIVTEQEKNEIEILFERRIALNELEMTLDSPYLSELEKTILQKKISEDRVKTQMSFDKWWQDMAQKYGWRGEPDKKWTVDFYTNEIFMV